MESGQMEEPKPKRCPACGSHHTYTDINGKAFDTNCMSVCKVFCGKKIEEMASLVQLANVCPLCLDWTKDHEAKDCFLKVGAIVESSQIMKLLSAAKMSCSVKGPIDTTQMEEPKKKPYKEPSVEEEQGDLAALKEAIEAEAGVSRLQRTLLHI